MTDLPRYDLRDLDLEAHPVKDGDWVKWGDVSARLQQLAQEKARLKTEIKELKARYADMDESDEGSGSGAAGCCEGAAARSGELHSVRLAARPGESAALHEASTGGSEEGPRTVASEASRGIPADALQADLKLFRVVIERDVAQRDNNILASPRAQAYCVGTRGE